MNEGTVKHYNYDRGFGFIAAENGESYFFHISSVKVTSTCWEPMAGQKVTFDIKPSKKGLQAVNVQFV